MSLREPAFLHVFIVHVQYAEALHHQYPAQQGLSECMHMYFEALLV